MTKLSEFGRPPLFSSAEDMQERIVEFINNPPTKTMHTKDGDEMEVPHITITGLAIHLGFCSRQSFYDYEQKEDFSYTIKRARTLIEREYEMMLHNPQCTGAIFALKNLGWSDRQELEHSGPGGGPIQHETRTLNDFYADIDAE